MKTYIRKKSVLSIFLVVATLLFFVSCNDEKDDKSVSQKNDTEQVQQIPDGVRTAYYETTNGTQLTIVDTWKDGKLVHRTVNGEEDTHFTQEHQELFWGKNADINAAQRADNLVKQGWPCVRVLYYGTNFNGNEEYCVEYDVLDEDGNCWYDKEGGFI